MGLSARLPRTHDPSPVSPTHLLPGHGAGVCCWVTHTLGTLFKNEWEGRLELWQNPDPPLPGAGVRPAPQPGTPEARVRRERSERGRTELLVVLSGGGWAPSVISILPGQSGGLVGGNVSFAKEMGTALQLSQDTARCFYCLDCRASLCPVLSALPCHPPDSTPLRPHAPRWSLPSPSPPPRLGHSALLAPGRACVSPWPSRPARLTILPGPAALRRGRSPSGCS